MPDWENFEDIISSGEVNFESHPDLVQVPGDDVVVHGKVQEMQAITNMGLKPHQGTQIDFAVGNHVIVQYPLRKFNTVRYSTEQINALDRLCVVDGPRVKRGDLLESKSKGNEKNTGVEPRPVPDSFHSAPTRKRASPIVANRPPIPSGIPSGKSPNVLNSNKYEIRSGDPVKISTTQECKPMLEPDWGSSANPLGEKLPLPVMAAVFPNFSWDGGAEKGVCHRRSVELVHGPVMPYVNIHITLPTNDPFSLEPFFGSLCIYDSSQGAQVTDCCWFPFYSARNIGFVTADSLKMAFPLADTSPALVLLLRIYRIHTRRPDDTFDSMCRILKDPKSKAAAKLKARALLTMKLDPTREFILQELIFSAIRLTAMRGQFSLPESGHFPGFARLHGSMTHIFLRDLNRFLVKDPKLRLLGSRILYKSSLVTNKQLFADKSLFGSGTSNSVADLVACSIASDILPSLPLRTVNDVILKTEGSSLGGLKGYSRKQSLSIRSELRRSVIATSTPLKWIRNSLCEDGLCSEYRSAAQYKSGAMPSQQTLKFFIPLDFSDDLFLFCDICSVSAKSAGKQIVSIGSFCVPIAKKGVILAPRGTTQRIRVFENHRGIMDCDSDSDLVLGREDASVPYVDVSVYSESTVLPQDGYVQTLLDRTDSIVRPHAEIQSRPSSGSLLAASSSMANVLSIKRDSISGQAVKLGGGVTAGRPLGQVLKDLEKAADGSLALFSPALLQSICACMQGTDCRPGDAFTALLMLFGKLDAIEASLFPESGVRSSMVSSLIQHSSIQAAEHDGSLLAEILLSEFIALMRSGGASLDSSLRLAWAVFDLITKSLVLLEQGKEGRISAVNRRGRFPDSLYKQLGVFVTCLAKELGTRDRKGVTLAKDCNKSVALFFSDLLDIGDRGKVFHVITSYLNELEPSNVVRQEMRVLLLRVLLDHRHFVPLCLPTEMWASGPIARVECDVCSRAFFIQLLVSEFDSAFANSNSAYISDMCRLMANLLTKFDYDKRYATKGRKGMLAVLMCPILDHLLLNVPSALNKMDDEISLSFSSSILWVVANFPDAFRKKWMSHHVGKISQALTSVLRNLLLHYDLSRERRSSGLVDPVSSGNRAADAKLRLENYFKSIQRKGAQSVSSLHFRSAKLAESPYASSRIRASPEKPDRQTAQVGANVSSACVGVEAAFILNALFRANIYCTGGVTEAVIELLFAAVEDLLSFRFPRPAIRCGLQFLALFLPRISSSLFEGQDSGLCRRVTSVLLAHLNVKNSRMAGYCLYLLLRQNFLQCNNIVRARTHASILLSKLVFEAVEDSSLLPLGLDYCREASSEDRMFENNNVNQCASYVDDICRKLGKMVGDTVQIAELQTKGGEFEKLADLCWRVSDAYSYAPELQATWIENLWRLNKDAKRHAEAGVAACVLASLIYHFSGTASKGGKDTVAGLVPLLEVARSHGAYDLKEPSAALSLLYQGFALGSESADAIIESQMFNLATFVKWLSTAVECFRHAKLYDVCFHVYKVYLFGLEIGGDFNMISEALSRMSLLCKEIADAKSRGSQQDVAAYYRVSFGTDGFSEQLIGNEFVYRETAGTRLPDMKERLESYFGKGVGANLVFLSASEPPPKDPAAKWLRLSPLDPFVKNEDSIDTTFLIDTFVQRTPFFENGKMNGPLSEQFQRVLLMKTEGTMPWLKSRLKISGTETRILSPIQNATYTLRMQAKKLRREVMQEPCSLHSLQLVLQGTVLARVNIGPLAIVQTFLSPEKKKNYPVVDVDELCESFRKLMDYCQAGLTISRQLVGEDLLPFHENLESGYQELIGIQQDFAI